MARRYGRYVWLNERKLKICRYIFDTHGQKEVFLGRFVSILRTYAALLAGSSRMRWSEFLPANAAGGIVWAGIYTVASYFAGNAIARLSGTIGLVIGGVALVGIVTMLLVVGRQTNRLGPAAEAAYPGPLEREGDTRVKECRGAGTRGLESSQRLMMRVLLIGTVSCGPHFAA